MDGIARDLRDQRIVGLRRDGLSFRAIGRELGMSHNGVAQALRRLSGDQRYMADLERRSVNGYRPRADHPCSECGRPCWKADEHRRNPEHQVVCLECRRAANRLFCPQCDVPFVTKCRATFCSLRCSSLYRWAHTDRPPRKKKFGTRRERAIRFGLPWEVYDALEIFERDRWRCQLCRKKVDREKRWPDPSAPTIDHVIPLSVPGSTGDVRSNVWCACWRCNHLKSNRGGGEQLALLG